MDTRIPAAAPPRSGSLPISLTCFFNGACEARQGALTEDTYPGPPATRKETEVKSWVGSQDHPVDRASSVRGVSSLFSQDPAGQVANHCCPRQSGVAAVRPFWRVLPGGQKTLSSRARFPLRGAASSPKRARSNSTGKVRLGIQETRKKRAYLTFFLLVSSRSCSP